jgi:hypothetical protein
VLGRATTALALAALALTVVGSVASAAAHGPSLRFSAAPRHVFAGKPMSVAVTARPSGVRCTLKVTYASGSRQRGLRATRARSGRARWEWLVPTGTKAGTARMTATCGRAGSVSRAFVVVGSIIPRRITVLQRGWSGRPSRTRGTEVSYGVVLQNDAADRDARDVTVLVNFVDANNFVFGSATTRVDLIPAGSRYALGNSIDFPEEAPIAKLEVVIQVAGWARKTPQTTTLAGVRVFPDERDPSWFGSLEGELINDHPTDILSRAKLSAILLDAEGNVLGGVRGQTSAALPPGARVFFKLTSGGRAIPSERVASAVVSVNATYVQPGS